MIAFQAWRSEVQSAQDRRLARQRRLGELRLLVADADHALQLSEARANNEHAMAGNLREETAAHAAREAAARALQHQLVVELEQAKAGLEALPSAAPLPPPPDPGPVQAARRASEQARRELASATSGLASLRTRREFLEEQLSRLEPLAAAVATLR